MGDKQMEIFNQMSATFAPEVVKKWEAMVAAWNMSPKASNPYEEPKNGKSYLPVDFMYILICI